MMQDLTYYYIPPKNTKLVDIVGYKIGTAFEPFDDKFIETQGEIILKITCCDGVFYLVRKDFVPRNHKDKNE